MAKRYTLAQARAQLGMASRGARRRYTRYYRRTGGRRGQKPSLVDLLSVSEGAINTYEAGLINPDDPRGSLANLRDSYTGHTSGWRYAWDMSWKPFLRDQLIQKAVGYTGVGRRLKRWKVPLLNVPILR